MSKEQPAVLTQKEKELGREGILFVISGSSGVGKGTLINKLMEGDEELSFSVSATTRSPRPGERDGREYFFMDRDKFLRMVEKGDFLEYAFVHGNYYGTPLPFVEEKIKSGMDVVLDIDVQGALQVMKKRPESTFIFIAPPRFDIEILRERLMKRNTETPEQMQKRLNTAQEEMKFAYKYEYIIFNDELMGAFLDLQSVIRAERLKSVRLSRPKDYRY